MESESSFRSVLGCRDIGQQDARISLQVQSCIVGKPPTSLQMTERHLLSHSDHSRMLLIGKFQECGMEFLFTPILWKWITDSLDRGIFSGYLGQLH